MLLQYQILEEYLLKYIGKIQKGLKLKRHGLQLVIDTSSIQKQQPYRLL